MIRFIIFLFLLFTSNLFSQTQNNFVEYTLKLEGSESFNEYLIYNNDESFYFGYGGIYDNFDKSDYKSLLDYFNYKKVSNTRIHFLNAHKEIFEYKATINPRGFVRDFISYNTIKWRIIKEYSEIMGYKCQKAEADFRGRRYIAWFTSDINTFEGPWKLKGLPGLILKVSDSNSKFIYEVKSIFINSKLPIPENFLKAFSYNVDEILDIKEAISMENNYLKERREQTMASFPSGTVFQNPPLRSEMREIIFEWEDSKNLK